MAVTEIRSYNVVEYAGGDISNDNKQVIVGFITIDDDGNRVEHEFTMKNKHAKELIDDVQDSLDMNVDAVGTRKKG